MKSNFNGQQLTFILVKPLKVFIFVRISKVSHPIQYKSSITYILYCVPVIYNNTVLHILCVPVIYNNTVLHRYCVPVIYNNTVVYLHNDVIARSRTMQHNVNH